MKTATIRQVRHDFGTVLAWVAEGKHKDLSDAYDQLLRYRSAVENPPLLFVCDLDRIIIHTNFTGSVDVTNDIPSSVNEALPRHLLIDRLPDGQSLFTCDTHPCVWAEAHPYTIDEHGCLTATLARLTGLTMLFVTYETGGHDPTATLPGGPE